MSAFHILDLCGEISVVTRECQAKCVSYFA